MFRQSGFFFLMLIGLVILGFSKTYFFKLDESFPIFIHMHVLLVGAWLLLIAGQAFLIRADERSVHRQLGEVSYLLAPLIIISGIYLARAFYDHRLGTVGLEDNLDFLWWAVSHFVLFGVFFTLAMVYRKRTELHSRFMITASLLFVSPALLRVYSMLGISVGDISHMGLSFIAIDLLLIWLIINDFVKKNTILPFTAGLFSFVFIQLGVIYAGDTAAWRYLARLLIGA